MVLYHNIILILIMGALFLITIGLLLLLDVP